MGGLVLGLNGNDIHDQKCRYHPGPPEASYSSLFSAQMADLKVPFGRYLFFTRGN